MFKDSTSRALVLIAIGTGSGCVFLLSLEEPPQELPRYLLLVAIVSAFAAIATQTDASTKAKSMKRKIRRSIKSPIKYE